MQADNGTEFINSTITTFFSSHGIHLRLSCPYTSQQNGKAERALRTLNNITQTLLFQANMPASYWAEALSAATHLINLRPSQSIDFCVPYERLYRSPADYSTLRVFGCLCYPNLSATAPHKLSPRSTACVFLGYPSSHRGYRCLDMATRRVITSRHVVFDECTFPFAASLPTPPTSPSDSLDFLLDLAATDSLPSVLPPAPRAVTSPGAAPLAAPNSPVTREPASADFPPAASSPAASPTPVAPTPDPSTTAAPAATPPPPPADNTHPMTTRAKRGIHVPPRERLNLSTIESAISPIPKTYRTALHDPHWRAAMTDEFDALMQNRTWTLVPLTWALPFG
jgi:histone deacetylase 1/2